MDACQYRHVTGEVTSENVILPWRPFLRQLLVCSGVWVAYFMLGLCFGTPTVLIQQIRREANSTAAVSDEMATWLSSVHGFAGSPWVVILPVLTGLVGRKLPYLFVSVSALTAFTVFYCSVSLNQLLISEIIEGALAGCQITISVVIVTEYTSPRHRGVFLTIKSASFVMGMWAANAIGTFYHWKNIGIVGITCSVYLFTTILCWPESPYWLAAKGRFAECSASHRLLKGCDKLSEEELECLIKSQKEYISDYKKRPSDLGARFWHFLSVIRSEEFYKPISLSLVTMALYHLSGKFVCSVYAIEIIKKITEAEATAYIGMLVLDGITVLGMFIGVVLSKFLNRRTILLVFSSVGILFLFIISLYLYLIKLLVFTENKYLSILLLTIFSMSISCGPMVMTTTVYAELIPLRFRSFSIFIIGLFFEILMGTLLKLSPFIFKTYKLHGAFLFYGVSASVCLFILYKYLPETKDKTFQEIEDSMKTQRSKSAEFL